MSLALADRQVDLTKDAGIAIQSGENKQTPIDPRFGPLHPPLLHPQDVESGPPSSSATVTTFNEEKSKDHSSVGPFYVEFEEGDSRNPVNFSRKKKWAITAVACFSTFMASSVASAYNIGFPSMIRDLNCTEFQATIGLSVYALGFGVVPLVSASFSEEFGRQPLYVGSAIGFGLMYVMIGLSKNIQTVILARLLQGAFGSTGATMVGGTIADIWTSKERGLPMSLFALMAVGGTGTGPVMYAWVEMNSRLRWRWIQWIQLMVFGVYLVLIPLVMRETRISILLIRIAKKLRKETGDQRYRARAEDERAKLRTLIYVSCTRPIYLLTTEPVVISFSLWIGFAWGIFYCLIESVGNTFSNLHHFRTGGIGGIFSTMVLGSVIGFSTNMLQEILYQKYASRRGPEARLYSACAAAILFPASMFLYAWSSDPSIHWIVPGISIVFFVWATYVIYLAVFTYLADCYGPFASSALAGQSLARNLMATAFPLFSQQMFRSLKYKWANTLFGAIATVMIPTPFILFFYGPKIRMLSKFSRTVLETLPQGEKS